MNDEDFKPGIFRKKNGKIKWLLIIIIVLVILLAQLVYSYKKGNLSPMFEKVNLENPIDREETNGEEANSEEVNGESEDVSDEYLKSEENSQDSQGAEYKTSGQLKNMKKSYSFAVEDDDYKGDVYEAGVYKISFEIPQNAKDESFDDTYYIKTSQSLDDKDRVDRGRIKYSTLSDTLDEEEHKINSEIYVRLEKGDYVYLKASDDNANNDTDDKNDGIYVQIQKIID